VSPASEETDVSQVGPSYVLGSEQARLRAQCHIGNRRDFTVASLPTHEDPRTLPTAELDQHMQMAVLQLAW